VIGEVVKRLAKALAVVVVVVLAAIALLLLVISLSVHSRTEHRIRYVLSSHYAPAQVRVKERVDWHNGGSDFGFGGSVCFDIEVIEAGQKSVARKIALVESDSDGGTWAFVGEQPSMNVCKSYFWRG